MTDIVKRLREACNGKPAKIPWPHRVLHEAADEIERLREIISIAMESIDADDVIGAYEKLAKAKELRG